LNRIFPNAQAKKSDNQSAHNRGLASQAESVRQPPRALLGKNVNRLRMERGLTQDELAELAEIDRRYVQRIEAGTANPGIDVICRLRQALRVSWDDLLPGNSGK
jgi:DNA-binding XRE family transcriptional regulator